MAPLSFYGSLATAGGVFLGLLTAYLTSRVAGMRQERTSIRRRMDAIKARRAVFDAKGEDAEAIAKNLSDILDEYKSNMDANMLSVAVSERSIRVREIRDAEAQANALVDEHSQLKQRYDQIDPSELYTTLRATVGAAVFSVFVPLLVSLLHVSGNTLSERGSLEAWEPVAVFVLWTIGLAWVLIHTYREILSDETSLAEAAASTDEGTTSEQEAVKADSEVQERTAEAVESE